jgi:hypothetical protein
MINTRLLSAWPNYFVVLAILGYWVVLGVLAARLIGAAPATATQGGTLQ